MKTIVLYEAEDGEQFWTREECEAYEDKLAIKRIGKDIFFFDEKQSPIPLTSGLDEVFYVIVKTEEAAQWMRDRAEMVEEDPFDQIPFVPGLYWYDFDKKCWHSWVLENLRLQSLKKQFACNWV